MSDRLTQSAALIVRDPDEEMQSFIKNVKQQINSYRQFHLLHTALKLKIFEEFKTKRTAAEVAEKNGFDTILFDFFCQSLSTIELLDSIDGCYVNSTRAKRFLTSNSPVRLLHHLNLLFFRAQPWNDLENILYDGPKQIKKDTYLTSNWMNAIKEGSMTGQVGCLIKRIDEVISIKNCKSLLDLGGGHGLYSIGFSYLYPHLKVTLFDLAEMIQNAQDTIDNYQADIALIAGDYYIDPLPKGFDIILCSFTQIGSNIDMIPQLKSSLQPNGYLVIRRHKASTSENPLDNLEWNLYQFQGRKKGSKKWEQTTTPSVQTYIKQLRYHGFHILLHEGFDEISEIIIAQKGGNAHG